MFVFLQSSGPSFHRLGLQTLLDLMSGAAAEEAKVVVEAPFAFVREESAVLSELGRYGGVSTSRSAVVASRRRSGGGSGRRGGRIGCRRSSARVVPLIGVVGTAGVGVVLVSGPSFFMGMFPVARVDDLSMFADCAERLQLGGLG